MSLLDLVFQPLEICLGCYLIHHFSYFKINYLSFLISLFSEASLFACPPPLPNPPLSYWVSLLRSHFLSLGWDNPPCRGLQSAGRPGKSLNYPFALKLKPNHNSPRSVRLRAPASRTLIVGLDFSFSIFSSSSAEMEI